MNGADTGAKAPLATRRLLAYGLPALPLAAAALPVYVFLPPLYAGAYGMDLALLGSVLLLARLADAGIDPALGLLADRWRRPRLLTGAGLLLMAAGVWLAFDPPAAPGWAYLLAALLPLYLGYSLASIAHLAWGSQLGATPHERTRVAAWREACGVIGVMAASLAPMALAAQLTEGLARHAALLVLVVLATLLVMRAAPLPAPNAASRGVRWREALAPLRQPAFRRLFGLFVLNGLASALPATLVMFFIDDALGLADRAGLFLALYFAAGTASLPLWLALSRRIGKEPAWRLAMLLAVAGFTGAAFLGQGDAIGFALVCVATGLALGADLALPPALLADLVNAAERDRVQAGAAAGLWQFATKLNLALAAGLALPLLALAGYRPGGDTIAPLYALYCLLPCLLKLLAALLLSLRTRHSPACPLPLPESLP